MEYISAEEFLKQPEEVQKVFLDWWRPSIGDLFAWNTEEDIHDMHEIACCTSTNMVNITAKNKGINEGERIPLLTESHLRRFIEDKINKKIRFTYIFKRGYQMEELLLFKDGDGFSNTLSCTKYEFLGDDLLQAYWKVAVDIAKHC